MAVNVVVNSPSGSLDLYDYLKNIELPPFFFGNVLTVHDLVANVSVELTGSFSTVQLLPDPPFLFASISEIRVRSLVDASLILTGTNYDAIFPYALDSFEHALTQFNSGNSAWLDQKFRSQSSPYIFTGSAGVDVFVGSAGDDVIDGGGGKDVLSGGLGDDLYKIYGADVTIIDTGGVDKIESSVDTTLAAAIENLDLVGTATFGKGNGSGNTIRSLSGLGSVLIGLGGWDTLVGGEGSDTIDGGGGHDILNGGAASDTLMGGAGQDALDGGTGVDTMTGGDGGDNYYVDEGLDVIVEDDVKGVDIVFSTVTYKLSPYIEVLHLLTKNPIDGYGNDQDNTIYGNEANNLLRGFGGDDTLVSNGGGDLLVGDTGNDTFEVFSVFDTAKELLDEGHDTVRSWVTTTLPENVEELHLLGSDPIDGTGNDLDNSIYGNSAANDIDGAEGRDTMAGGGGNDAYAIDNADDVVFEKSNEGVDTVFSVLDYKLGAHVENLVLTGAGSINGTGNSLANSILGNDKGNIIDGGANADAMTGGDGDDIYYVDHAGDLVAETQDEGEDLVLSSRNYALPDHVENLILLGSQPLFGTGNALANHITGNDAANHIIGLQGADTMIGLDGDDVYGVDDPGDRVIEAANQGFDTIYSSVSTTLPDNVEILALTGASPINGTGNGLSNGIIGNNAANVLDGRADAAGIAMDAPGSLDLLAGGGGHDTYIVHSSDDLVLEFANKGKDTVKAWASYVLPSHVENLILMGALGLDGTGNDLGNHIRGTLSANTLDGRQGADVMEGDLGDDVYIVDSSGDQIIEKQTGGTDTVFSSVSHVLADNVEKLILTGVSNLTGGGNDQDNMLIGNAGKNVLNGQKGADAMMGGLGDDIYHVNDKDDSVIEESGGGTDTVRSTVSFTLSANVERLFLSGSGPINGTGSDNDNLITGNGGANLVDGGAGADTMKGGLGDDTYVVDNMGDVVIEQAGAGNDTVRSSISHALAANLENLVLTGGAIDGTGNTGDNTLTGNDGGNHLSGGAGSDWLAGGLGDDELTGGGGADTFVFRPGDGHDVITDFSAITDFIDLHAYGFASYASVRAQMTQTSEGVHISLGASDDVMVLNATFRGFDLHSSAILL